jgi:hypothetical protein
MAIMVRDPYSNGPENIEDAIKAIGSGERRILFEAIYFHKTKAKKVSDLVQSTGLDRKRVLERGGELAKRGIVEQVEKDGEIAYEMISSIQATKHKIIRGLDNPKLVERMATKRRPIVTIRTPMKVVALSTKGADVKRVTIDEIDTFALAHKLPHGASMPKTVTEDAFKRGVQATIGQAGVFKDWGGENCDLYSSRLVIGGKRMTVAFAFKGPGEPGKLTPGKMGKNGDQVQRMFALDADVFIVQHWREIEASVVQEMYTYAVSKSVSNGGKRIYYGVIDGQDSERLRQAYPKKFGL